MKQKLLIVDDDLEIWNLASACLADAQTQCFYAEDGFAAIAMACLKKPDALLLDMNMPGLHGFDVCRQLKADRNTRSIPILFVTSNSDVTDKIRGIEIGASDFITKPFHTGELQARVRSVLRHQVEIKRVGGVPARDVVTGLFNREYFDQRLEADLAASRRQGRSLLCCIVEFGNWDSRQVPANCGDEIMSSSARALLAMLRREDVACRFDDHALAITGYVSNSNEAMELGCRIQAVVRAAANASQMTVNVGVALSRYSLGDSLVWHTSEALRNARISAPGTVQFGGELLEFELVDRFAREFENGTQFDVVSA